MKHIARFLFALCICVLLGTSCFAASDATVTGENMTANTGTEIEYRVSLAGNPGLTGFNIKLKFDTSVFSLVYEDGAIACTQGDFTGSGMMNCNAVDGGCQILWTNATNVLTDGTLFILKLQVADGVPTGDYPITVSYVPRNTVNYAEELVPLNCTSGTITVRTYQQTIIGEAKAVKQGETFDYTVSLIDNPGIASYDIFVQFDSGVFSLVKDTASDSYATRSSSIFTGGNFISKTYANAVEVFWTAATNQFDEGVLFTLHFYAKDEAELGTYPITISYVQENTLNAAEENVTFTCSNGEIKILSGTSVSFNIENAHSASIAAKKVPGDYLITAFYDTKGRMLFVRIVEISNSAAEFSIQQNKFDFQKTTCKVFLINSNFAPVSPCYVFQ